MSGKAVHQCECPNWTGIERALEGLVEDETVCGWNYIIKPRLASP